MRILLGGDFHLDSAMETGLSVQGARQRRNELLMTFSRFVDTAEERGAAEVTHIYLGQGDDAILLWEEGMDLPAAGEKTDR